MIEKRGLKLRQTMIHHLHKLMMVFKKWLKGEADPSAESDLQQAAASCDTSSYLADFDQSTVRSDIPPDF